MFHFTCSDGVSVAVPVVFFVDGDGDRQPKPQQQALFVGAVSIIWNEYLRVSSNRQPGLFCWVEGCVPVLFPFYKSKVLLWLCMVQMGKGRHLLCVLLVYSNSVACEQPCQQSGALGAHLNFTAERNRYYIYCPRYLWGYS